MPITAVGAPPEAVADATGRGLGRLLRRLAFVAGLAFLGWLALSVVNATHAGATPTAGAIRPVTGPAVRDVLAALADQPVTPLVAAVPVAEPVQQVVSAQLGPTVLVPLTYALDAVLAGSPSAAGSPARLAGPMPATSPRRSGPTEHPAIGSRRVQRPEPRGAARLQPATARAWFAAIPLAVGPAARVAPRPADSSRVPWAGRAPLGGPVLAALFGPGTSSSPEAAGAPPGFGTARAWTAEPLRPVGGNHLDPRYPLRDNVAEPSVSPD